MRKKFVALAGLLEIADGELERIQKDSDALKAAVEEELISRLTSEGFEESGTKKKGKDSGKTLRSVRDLIYAGELMEALQLYNNKIDIEPSSHTLLIGRAKIKFLLGNTETALSDLSKAKAINSNDPAIENLRRLIEDGNVEAVNTGNYGIVNSEAISGVFGLMEQGKGKEAFDLITEMEEDGYNRAFAFINKSACCLLELDVPGCSEYLSKLNTYIGTPMSVNIHILRFVAACIDGIEKRECINDLNLMLSGAPQFELTLSPIQHFLVGFRRRHRKIYNMGPIYMLDPMRSSWYI